MAIIDDIINRHVKDRKGSHLFISRAQIAAICRDYADNVKPVKAKKKPGKRRKIAEFAHGYKLGYLHRSNVEYNESMRLFWLRYVAPDTEMQEKEIELRDLEIVEPEVIVNSKGI
jgi:hypothetical protein